MHLFARPFDLAAVTAFELDNNDAAQLRWNQEVLDAKARQTHRRKLALDAFGVSVGAAALGAGALWSAHNVSTAALRLTVPAPTPIPPDRRPSAQTANAGASSERDIAGGVLLGVAGASAVTGALLYFWPSAPHLSVSSTPGCEACLAFQRSF